MCRCSSHKGNGHSFISNNSAKIQCILCKFVSVHKQLKLLYNDDPEGDPSCTGHSFSWVLSKYSLNNVAIVEWAAAPSN